MLNFTNYTLFYEHLYDFPGNINSFLDAVGKQLHIISGDLNLAKMEVEINMPQIFCDRFPFIFNQAIYDTKEDVDLIPVSTDFATDHEGLITITTYSKKGTHWNREEVKEIIFLNEQISVLISRSRLQSQLKKAEETDNVTNVLNLAGIMHVGELLSVKKMLPKFSVVSLNINNFSNYNDKYGHVNGDLLLKNYAIGISDFLGKDGVIGRIGADNFIIVVSSAKVESLIQFLHRYVLQIEMEDMSQENIGFSTRLGICDGTHSNYFPQLIVNSKMALHKTNPTSGHLFERYTSQ